MSVARSGALLPPRALKRLLELDGFTVEGEDDYHWALAKDELDDIVIVPKAGHFVAGQVTAAVFSLARIGGRSYLFTDHQNLP